MPLNINLQQILLHLFNFALLFAILYFLLYSPVKKFMDARIQHYKEMDEQARKNLENSAAAQKEYERRLETAEAEGKAIREDSCAKAQDMSSSIVSEAREQAAHIITVAKAEAERERKRVLTETGDEISQMVIDAAAKLVFEDTDSAYENFLNSVEECDKYER